jgi:cobalamin biosynthesis protein CbiG
VGSPSVAEAAALRAAIGAKLWVEKQVVRDKAGGMTVAIAREISDFPENPPKLK